MYRAYILSKSARSPRFMEREDRVQRVVADGHAICILPERSAAAPGLVTRLIEGLSLERELVIATVSGSTTPVEIRKIAQLASLKCINFGSQRGPHCSALATLDAVRSSRSSRGVAPGEPVRIVSIVAGKSASAINGWLCRRSHRVTLRAIEGEYHS